MAVVRYSGQRPSLTLLPARSPVLGSTCNVRTLLPRVPAGLRAQKLTHPRGGTAVIHCLGKFYCPRSALLFAAQIHQVIPWRQELDNTLGVNLYVLEGVQYTIGEMPKFAQVKACARKKPVQLLTYNLSTSHDFDS